MSQPSFTYHPSLERLNVSPRAYLAANPSLTDLVVSATLFDVPFSPTPDNNTSRSSHRAPRTLLIQRSATDGYPLAWECPGGGVELGLSTPPPAPEIQSEAKAAGIHGHDMTVQQGSHQADPTILHALGRELFEETGLTMTRVEALIDDTCEFTARKGKIRARKFTFLVDFDRTTEEGKIKVLLNPAEHQDSIWATEEEVRGGEDGAGRKIVFAFNDQRERLLEGFRIMKEGIDSGSGFDGGKN